jgi:hypothetical protein
MDHEIPRKSGEVLESLHPKLPVLNYRLESRYELQLCHVQNLHELEMKAAKFGVDVPIALSNQIRDTRSTIKELEGEIKQLELSIAQVITEIEKEEKKKQTTTTPPPPHHRFGTFLQWPPFNEYAKNACEILVVGGSLDNLTQLYGNFLVKKALDGCEVRLILMDPESPAIPQIELWSDPDLPQDYYRRAICRSLRHLAEIDKKRKVKIRLNPSIPALAVVILDGSQPHGRIRVDIQPFQAVTVERPVFELTHQGADLQWYNLFYRQYSEILWSVAKPVDLSDLPPICL